MKDKEGFYQDGVTRITDPFYICICPEGHRVWNCIYTKQCPVCGSRLEKCIPANKYRDTKKEAVS